MKPSLSTGARADALQGLLDKKADTKPAAVALAVSRKKFAKAKSLYQ